MAAENKVSDGWSPGETRFDLRGEPLALCVCVHVCVCVHMCIHVCVKSSLCQVLTMQDLVEFSFFLIIVLLLTSFSDKETEAQ